MPPADCLIVGGGAAALVGALTLAASGRRVMVVDDDNPSATIAAAGVLSPLPPWGANPSAAKLAADGAAMYPSLLAELGDDCEWQQCGMHVLPPYDDAALRRWKSGGGAVETATLPEGVRFAESSALFLPSVARLHPPKLLAALRRAVGARRRVAKVTGVCVENGRAIGAELADGGRILAGEVVLSAGAWSGGLCPPPAPEITPWRGQMLLYPPLSSLPGVILREAEGFYLSRRADGTLLAGSTMENVGYDAEPTAAGVELLRQKAEELLPALAGARPLRTWAGLRPMTADGRAHIRRHPTVEGLYLNAGHCRYGLTMAPAAARELLRLMDGGAATG